MSTTQKPPHPIFAATWIFWYVVLGYYFFTMTTPEQALAALAVLAYFFVLEILALKVNWRWTLSATMTWTVRKLSHHTRPFEGWNWLLVPAAVIPSIVMLRIGWVLGGWWGVAFAWFLATPSAVLCHQHWLRPDVQG
jgi:hypothetical protein